MRTGASKQSEVNIYIFHEKQNIYTKYKFNHCNKASNAIIFSIYFYEKKKKQKIVEQH